MFDMENISDLQRARFFFLFLQEPTGEQHGALERSVAVVARAHRVGDKKRHGAYRSGASVWRCGCAAKTTGKSRRE